MVGKVFLLLYLGLNLIKTLYIKLLTNSDSCYALIVPSDRGLSQSEVTSITSDVIHDPIRIKGSLRT